MPYITLEGGKMTAEQKVKFIEKVTDVASEIMHVPSEFFTVTIKELPDVNIGIGGKTIDKVKKEFMENHKR